MTLEVWSLFLALVSTVILMPGPAAALCLSHGVTHGWIKTFATIFGLLLSSLVLIGLSIAGLGAILAASGTLFNVVKYLGAAYLIYLGVRMWRTRPSGPIAKDSLDPKQKAMDGKISELFRTGFLVGLSNPKDLLFFGALFPQFITTTTPMLGQVVALSLTWCAVALVVMAGYAAIGERVAKNVDGLNARGIFNRITGSIFIAAGGVLAWAKRTDA
jgi:threonine/homoserine/homoserine lactone efflux protein